MPLETPRSDAERAFLANINEAGNKCAEIISGYPPLVAYNVAAGLLVAAMKAEGLTVQHAYDCIESHWESDDGRGFKLTLLRPS